MMRTIILGLGLLVSALSGTAGAEEFNCEVPWYSKWVDCSKSMFAVRPGEKLTIEVTGFTVENLEPASGTPIFAIVDQNRKTELHQLSAPKGKPVVWTNNTGKECIVAFSARVGWEGTRLIKGRYTVTAPR